jgi:hypothetical protein
MRNTKTILTALCVFLGTAAMAQQTTGANETQQKAPSSGPLKMHSGSSAITPVKPAETEPKKADIKSSGTESTKPDLYERKQKEQAAEGKNSVNDKELKGAINIDFGIAKEGESFTTFFPFNIKTLESQETPATPVINRSDIERYSLYNNTSGITDVKLAGGKYAHRLDNTRQGNGFNVQYTAGKPGAVNETVEVYTKQGRILYHLTGYVVEKDTEMTMK